MFLAAALLVIFSNISPVNADIKIYLLIYFLVYILFVLIVWSLLDFVYHKISNSLKIFSALIISTSPVSILAIASLSNLSLIDIVLSIAIPLVLVWYIRNKKIID